MTKNLHKGDRFHLLQTLFALILTEMSTLTNLLILDQDVRQEESAITIHMQVNPKVTNDAVVAMWLFVSVYTYIHMTIMCIVMVVLLPLVRIYTSE